MAKKLCGISYDWGDSLGPVKRNKNAKFNIKGLLVLGMITLTEDLFE